MHKKIIVFYSVIAIVGLISEIFLEYGSNYAIAVAKSYTTFISFGLMGFDGFDFSQVNYINIVFYILLLTGTILFAFDTKKSRMVRFAASALFLVRVVSFVAWLVILSFRKDDGYGPHGIYVWLGSAFNTCLTVFLIWFSYAAIKYLSNAQNLKVTKREYSESIVVNLVKADRFQRFFNLILDSLLVMFIFSPLLKVFIRMDNIAFIAEYLENAAGPRGALWIIVLFFRLIYYMLSESFFQASPAKFLTGTRVVDGNDEKAKAATIFWRTLSRFVPFEAFSFLGSRDGWHDRWTDTHVVKEE